MTPFALVMAYYENAGMLREHARQWLKLPEELRRNLAVIVVDDGSPTAPAARALDDAVLAALRAGLQAYEVWRMGVDVPWNQDACRNVGVSQAQQYGRWVMLTDMDHVVPVGTWRRLMEGKLQKHRAYRFGRVNAPAGDAYKPHPNTWALTTDLYWFAGGYDEALAGNYGTDGDFIVRLSRVAEVVQLPEVVWRYPREVIPDASTTTLTRKSPEQAETVKRLIKGRDLTKWKPRHFSFPCDRVL